MFNCAPPALQPTTSIPANQSTPHITLLNTEDAESNPVCSTSTPVGLDLQSVNEPPVIAPLISDPDSPLAAPVL